MRDVPDSSLDRLLAGELSAQEQRSLAQEALDDPELFDALTAAAMIKSTTGRESAAPPASTHASGRSVGTRRPRAMMLAALASAAAVVLAIGLSWYRFASGTPPDASSSPIAPGAGTTTSSSSAAAVTPPTLLTARQDARTEQPSATFRTGDTPSRFPKRTGSIVSEHDGNVDIDLGSLDGIRQGSELHVFRGRNDTTGVGRVTVTAVFRERSRGRSGASHAMQPGDRVDVAPSVHVAAILAQVAARRSAGDVTSAHALAELAVSQARTSGVPPDIRRRALDQLGTLKHQKGELDEAGRLLRAAADEFDAAPVAGPVERAEVLNELGAVQIDLKDYVSAERTLQAAQAHATDAMKVRVTNNLGAVAALRGDRLAAERLYRSARALAGDAAALDADRLAIDRNLDGLGTRR